MNAKITFTRTVALATGLLAVAGIGRAAEADALPTFTDNYIKFSGVLPSVSGSNAAFQRRAQISHDGAGGIEALSYAQDLNKETNVQVDGKLLPGAEDYLAQVKVTKNEVGSFDVGYKRFRTYYDGLGGFFPGNNAWLPIYNRSRYVDRAKFYVDATVALPKAPVFAFKYSNSLRNGIKDSTIWGDSDFTGIPIYSQSALNPVTSTRKILPAYTQLGERTQEWEASVRQSFGETTASFAIIGTRINNLDTRFVNRYAGELKPYPAIPSNPLTLVPAALANNPNFGFDSQGFKENALNYEAKVETKLSPLATVYAEASYRLATGDNSASRLINASIASATGPQTAVGLYTAGGRPPYSYTMAGNLKSTILTGVVGVRTNPLPDLAFNFAIRGEDANFHGDNAANYQSTLLVQSTGALTAVPVATTNRSRINEKPFTPAIDGRYTGIPALALYASWDYRTLKQDERTYYGAFSVVTSGATAGALSGPVNPAFDNIKEKHQNIKVGANWTPNSFFNLRPEFFTKDHENRFEGYGLSAGDKYILNYDIYGARVTGIVRPIANVTLNTRYTLQRGQSAIADDISAKADSGDSRRVQLGETIDWAPSKVFYIQGTVSKVWDTIITSYPRVTGVAQTVNHNADNNYWNGSVVAVFAVDKETDASLQTTYYKSDNYNPALAATTMPFGQSGKEYTVSAGVKHKFSDRWVGSAKVGYFSSRNDTTGGNTNFHGPLAYLAIEHAL